MIKPSKNQVIAHALLFLAEDLDEFDAEELFGIDPDMDEKPYQEMAGYVWKIRDEVTEEMRREDD
jgi:hypothetical protein